MENVNVKDWLEINIELLEMEVNHYKVIRDKYRGLYDSRGGSEAYRDICYTMIIEYSDKIDLCTEKIKFLKEKC